MAHKYADFYHAVAGGDEQVTHMTSEEYRLLQHHGLLAYAYPRLTKTPYYDAEEEKQITFVNQLNYEKSLRDLREIALLFNAKEIDYRLVKGLGIAVTYPEPYTRLMGDHDILVKKEDMAAATNLLLSLGYVKLADAESFKDVTFVKDGCLTLELHHGLLDPDRESVADELLEEVLGGVEALDIEGLNLKVPVRISHFRYIVLHLMKHVRAERNGRDVRAFLDIKHFAQGFGIDVKAELPYYERLGYGEFYRGIISYCYHYLNMEIQEADWLMEEEDTTLSELATYICESVYDSKHVLPEINWLRYIICITFNDQTRQWLKKHLRIGYGKRMKRKDRVIQNLGVTMATRRQEYV